MGLRENRIEHRKRVLIPAFVSDTKDSYDVACLIRDMSKTGCQLVGEQIVDLPDVVHVVPEGFDAPMVGRIAWRQDKSVGVSFVHEDDWLLLDLSILPAEPSASDHSPDTNVTADAPLGYASRLERMQARLNGRPLRRREPV